MENKVDSIQKDVNILADNFITDKDKKNFVIYKGQKLEADIAYIEIYQQAKKSIYVVDDYMNAKSLQHLSQKADGVEVVLFTSIRNGWCFFYAHLRLQQTLKVLCPRFRR